MNPMAVQVKRVRRPGLEVPEALGRDLHRFRTLAWLLDARFSVGNVRFGLDALIGLIPFVGDTLIFLLGLYSVRIAVKHKLGGAVVAMMIGNLVLDWLIGMIPALGDLFDVFFKAHLRNLAILEKAVARKYTPPNP